VKFSIVNVNQECFRIGLLAGLASALLLAGCASVPDAPASHQARAAAFRPPPGKALVYVFRPSRLAQAGTLAELTLDARKFGTLSQKTYLCAAVKPGRHQLKVITFFEGVAQSFDAEADQLCFFQVAPRKDRWVLTPVPETAAREEMAKCRLSGNNTFEAGERELR